MTQEERDARRTARNNIRKMLWQWGNTMEKIRKLERERAFYRDQADDRRITLRSPSLTGMPRGGKHSDLSDVIVGIQREQAMYERQAERINAEIADVLRLRNCMQQCIDRLSPLQEKIIAYRYSDGHNWQYIAMKLSYDVDYIKKLDARSMDDIGALIAEAQKAEEEAVDGIAEMVSVIVTPRN